MQRGVRHVAATPSLRNTYLAIHTWATSQTSCGLHRCTAKASRYRLHDSLSGQIQRRFKHGEEGKVARVKPRGGMPPGFEKFRWSLLETTPPWVLTRRDIKEGKVDPKYLSSDRYKESQATRHEWDYEIQSKEDPEHARYLRFWINAAWFMRKVARQVGCWVSPDGFIRLSDALRFRPFRNMDEKEFVSNLYLDPDNRFDVARLPDLVNGKLQDIFWVRTKVRHRMPEVVPTNRRILHVRSINTAVYFTSLENWDYIKKHGIPPAEWRFINLFKDLDEYVFDGGFPRDRTYLCVTIDCVAAADAGVMFYKTDTNRLFATIPSYISETGHIPRLALRSAVQLRMSAQKMRDHFRVNQKARTGNKNNRAAAVRNDDVATNRSVADRTPPLTAPVKDKPPHLVAPAKRMSRRSK